MKKLFLFIFSILLIIFLVGCTKDESLPTEPDPISFHSFSYSDSILTYKSDIKTRSIIQYSDNSNFLNEVAYSLGSETTNHSITLLDIESDTTYYYRAKYRDGDTIYYSEVKEFTTGTITPRSDLLTIYYIDVKQGDSNLIVSPGGEAVLIDAGYGSYAYDSWAGSGVKITLNFINNLSISQIEHLVLTHPHGDHVGGLADILSYGGGTGFTINNVYDNKISYYSTAYSDFLDGVSTHTEANYIMPSLGSEISLDSGAVKIKLINNKNLTDPDGNANLCSLTYHLTYKNFTAMFQGDAETEAMENMINAYPNDLSSHFYKVGHHGSYNGTSREWLSELRPVACFIPVGAGNPYGHPHEQTMTRLDDYEVEVYRADKHGTIKVLTDGEDNFTVIREK